MLKSYHKDFLKQNQISIDKIIKSESVVQINTAGGAENKRDSQAKSVKFDLRMDCKEAERDFFKICAISQIFSRTQLFMEKLKDKNPQEMYERAKDP